MAIRVCVCVQLLIRYSQLDGMPLNIQRCIDVGISILILTSQVYDLNDRFSTGPLQTFLNCFDLTLYLQQCSTQSPLLTRRASNLVFSIASSPGLTSLTSSTSSSLANSSLFLFRGRVG
jgi:hypothetical protein